MWFCLLCRVLFRLEAELWGVLCGLRLCWARGWRYISCQVDLEVDVRVIKGEQVLCLAGGSMVREIRSLLALSWDVHFDHVFREANRCVDALVTIGCNQDESLIVF